MKSKKGFTLIEIIVIISFLIIIAGLFTLNLVRTLNKNKDEENKSMLNIITSAADAYVSSNPESLENLYKGYGYVDLTLGVLRDSGFLSKDLKDAETGENLLDSAIVRVSLKNNDVIEFKFIGNLLSSNIVAWDLVANDLYIDYNANVTQDIWCRDHALEGLGDQLYLVNNQKNSEYDIGEKYRNSYGEDGVNLKVLSCDVNPKSVGKYQITYSFIDPYSKVERTDIRNVYVNTSGEDIVSFSAVINPNNLGVSQKIAKGSDDSEINIKIVEKKRKGDTNTIFESINTLNTGLYGYKIDGFDTSSIGTKTATIFFSKTNSDGSRPKAIIVNYEVVNSFLTDIIQNSGHCTTATIPKLKAMGQFHYGYHSSTKGDVYYSNNVQDCYYYRDYYKGTVYSNACYTDSPLSGCYYTGSQSSNYVKYNDTMYRIYAKDGDIIKLIYEGNDIIHPYGQIGDCKNLSCNNGNFLYTSLTYYNSCEGYECGFRQPFLIRVLDEFYINKRVDSKYIQNNTKIGLLSLDEYKAICEYKTSKNCCTKSNNYLVGERFWLVNLHSLESGGSSYSSADTAAFVYHYTVETNGTIGYDGAYKPHRANSAFTTSLVVRPIIQLNNPLVLSGVGTKSNPYIINS